MTLPSSVRGYPDIVAQAVSQLRLAGVNGPYALVLGSEPYTAVNGGSDEGYPVLQHIQRLIDGDIIWAPAIRGGFVLTTRGGDFELDLGQDISIGYLGHSETSVRLYLQESFTFRLLTTEAAVALDAELRRRNLTESDQAKHQQFVKRNEQREAKRRRRKIFGTRRDRRSWVDLFWALTATALISFTYLALPSRYHLTAGWQEPAVDVMFASVFIGVASSVLWRKIAFWMSLVISSAIHLFIVHAWIQRVGHLSRGQGKLAVLLGFVLFFAVYAFVWVLRRNFYGEDARDKRDGRALT